MIRRLADTPEAIRRRTFNLGVGIIVVIPTRKLEKALRLLNRAGEKPWIVGEVTPQRRGKSRVQYT